jgi:hypothetical protein
LRNSKAEAGRRKEQQKTKTKRGKGKRMEELSPAYQPAHICLSLS